LIGLILFTLAVIHALIDGKNNRLQRILMLASLFVFGIFLEYLGIISGHHYYAVEVIMILEVVPLSIPLAWVGIIYSAMIIGEKLDLTLWMRILTTTLIALSLDWGMDPIAVELGLWTWVHGGNFFGVPSFNFIGWFIIPIAYLLSYSLNWNKEGHKLEILLITQIDNHNSIRRKLYTIFLVVPVALTFMTVTSLITLIPVIYNLPVVIVIIWEILTVSISSWMIIKRRSGLGRSQWFDLIPPFILLFIACDYAFLGFLINQVLMGIIMLITGIPFLLALIFTLQKKRK